ncbi:Hypothetical protein SRAE_2000190500 [Strongyloides ratti]|uniref:Uncharacterized protein n=1 Tax=Strongyloides ratti TaxID=34506 RepID=A0A090LBV0_STRRB|nr:Hypothetical protein SRAE_2000190500 [Strongyloides ratti]CEF67241.1 Hypothetical protein SRAE_2000190500 [Strongyloides ratti]
MKLSIFFFILNIYLVYSRSCSDSKKGVCEVDDLGGWCYHNITSNEYNCDENNFCGNKENLKGRTNFGGCYKSGNSEESTECCCNKGELCNLAMMVLQYEGNDDLQKCYFAKEKSDEETIVYKECIEPYCLLYMEKDLIGGVSKVFHGCETKSIYKYKTAKIEDEIIGNNSQWKDFEYIFHSPRCSEMLNYVEPNENGTKIACIDTTFVDNNVEKKRKYCCCKGSDFCNEKISWSHPTISHELFGSIKNLSSKLVWTGFPFFFIAAFIGKFFSN